MNILTTLLNRARELAGECYNTPIISITELHDAKMESVGVCHLRVVLTTRRLRVRRMLKCIFEPYAMPSENQNLNEAPAQTAEA